MADNQNEDSLQFTRDLLPGQCRGEASLTWFFQHFFKKTLKTEREALNTTYQRLKEQVRRAMKPESTAWKEDKYLLRLVSRYHSRILTKSHMHP
jgi:hypothetical protein